MEVVIKDFFKAQTFLLISNVKQIRRKSAFDGFDDREAS